MKEHLQTLDVLLAHVTQDLREPTNSAKVSAAVIILESAQSLTMLYR